MTDSTPDAPIVFLSGAGLPEWIWDDIRSGLRIESHVARYPRGRSTTLDQYAEAVLERAPAGRLIIVAHSIGGVVACRLVAMAPHRVGSILGVAASVPRPGSSFLTTLPLPQRLLLGPALRVVGTRPPAQQIRTILCAGLGDDQAERITAEFQPESRRLYTDKTGPHTFPARSAYVLTTRDPQLRLAAQHEAADRLGARHRWEMATGHLPMLQDPTALAAVVNEFAGPR